MTADQKTYQRAVTASFLGLIVQVAITAALGLVYLWTGTTTKADTGALVLHGNGDPVILAAFWHALGGLGIWVTLMILYRQHHQERVEAMEAEVLARRQGTDSSIFETTADDLAVKQKQLRWLYRWLVPAVSLLTSGYLIARGIVTIQKNVAEADKLVVPDTRALPLMAAAAGVAFIAFLFSRYLAGMAKVTQWQLLRSGASYLMGNVVVAFLIAASMLLVNFEFQWLFRGLVYVIPVFMVLVGIEFALNFVLNIYRPRKLGEVPRPAFDSRLLSFLTSPESIAKSINEAINYQFGFEITKSWFWQLLSRVFLWLIALGIVVILLISSVLVVEPNQLAVVTRFGKLSGEPRGPGLHLKMPWPVEQAEFYDVHAVRVVTIGKAETADEQSYFKEQRDPMDMAQPNEKVVLWSNRHTEDEMNLIVAPPTDIVGGEAPDTQASEKPGEPPKALRVKAPPISLVNAEVMVIYRVRPESLVGYIKANADASRVEGLYRDAIRRRAGLTTRLQKEADKFKPSPNYHANRVRNLAVGHVTRYLLRHTVDEWIGSASVAAGPALLKDIRADADQQGLGIEVIDVAIAGVHPPQKVADAFHEVINAQQQSKTTVENAQRDSIRIKAEAAGSVETADLIDRLIREKDEAAVKKATEAELAEADRRIEDVLRRAGGETAAIISGARATRWELENRERGRALAFEAQHAAYLAAPKFYMARQYLKIAGPGLADANKIIVATDRQSLTIRGDFKEVETNFSFQKPDER